MKTNLMSRLTKIDEMTSAIDAGLWQGKFSEPDLAETAKENLIGTAERIRGVLKARYGEVVK